MLRDIQPHSPPVGEQDVLALEKKHGVCLPHQYKLFLLQNNGGRPSPSLFPIHGLHNNRDGNIQTFFGIHDPYETSDLDVVLHAHSESIPQGIIPIACTDGYDFLVLDCRIRPDSPVYFWDRRHYWGSEEWREVDLYPIAENFEELLKLLHSRENEVYGR